MENSLKENGFYSLGLMPVLMGLGHLAPAIGAIRTATGSYQFPTALLGMIGTAAALVDSYDTYKDVPLSNRPRAWIWRIWIYFLWGVVFICTYYSGFQTAAQMYRFSLIGLLWGTPCVPLFSTKAGFFWFKPKTVFREAKSLVVAVCMGYVTADVSMFYFCHRGGACSEYSLRSRSLCLAILYQFFRETICDTRDIVDDTRDGMKTLPVRLGKTRTLLLMAGFGVLFDTTLTGGLLITLNDTEVDISRILGSILRVAGLMGFYSRILQHPKENYVAWGAMSLLGLVPLIWAQGTLS